MCVNWRCQEKHVLWIQIVHVKEMLHIWSMVFGHFMLSLPCAREFMSDKTGWISTKDIFGLYIIWVIHYKHLKQKDCLKSPHALVSKPINFNFPSSNTEQHTIALLSPPRDICFFRGEWNGQTEGWQILPWQHGITNVHLILWSIISIYVHNLEKWNQIFSM